jgi:tyrosyl-tRNA synthetase
LTRRLYRKQVFGLTLPLITKSNGTKFGKTESGTIWLDASKTSPYTFYQFWINTADADVYRFLRYFTFLPESEMLVIEEKDKFAKGRPEAQTILATEITRIVHGEAGLQAALRISQALFSGVLQKLTESDMKQLYQDGMPTSDVANKEISLVQMLVNAGLAKSNNQARSFISSGAVQVNGLQVRDTRKVLLDLAALHGYFHVLRRGKKRFHLLRCV